MGKQLGIKYFRGIYSRDNLLNKIRKLETGIINLDDSMGGAVIRFVIETWIINFVSILTRSD